MVALSRQLAASAVSQIRWIGVEEASAVAACRNAATTLAARLGFPASRSDQVALAATEAGSNLHKHARDGAMLVRGCEDGLAQGIEIVTIDSGPGIRDVPAAQRDGHSTAGTLGIGLGSIRRMADFCDLYSAPGHGTGLVARFWPEPGRHPVRGAGLSRPIRGESVCGDAFAAVQAGDVLTAIMCDGLGHGPPAAAAANVAISVVVADPDAEPAALLERVHRRLGSTRGGAAAVVQVTAGSARFAGLGNIAGWLISDGNRTGLVSVPGIAGHQARSIRTFEYQVPAGAALVLHSDGLTSRWDVRALPGLEARDPLVIAATLLAHAGVHRDDAGILVLKP